MLKKLLTAAAASAFALTLYTAPAAACPGSKNKIATEEKQKDKEATKKAEKKSDSKKKNQKNDDSPKKKAT